MAVITNQLDFLSEVLQDFCELHNLEFMSADDILYTDDNKLTLYEREWLSNYISIWDTIANLEGVI
tara:strand:- start:98 stop:295 length:198 start_codon:yes stop_codon:yes gene_type:complete